LITFIPWAMLPLTKQLCHKPKPNLTYENIANHQRIPFLLPLKRTDEEQGAEGSPVKFDSMQRASIFTSISEVVKSEPISWRISFLRKFTQSS
jgi:hypothetical protein